MLQQSHVLEDAIPYQSNVSDHIDKEKNVYLPYSKDWMKIVFGHLSQKTIM